MYSNHTSEPLKTSKARSSCVVHSTPYHSISESRTTFIFGTQRLPDPLLQSIDDSNDGSSRDSRAGSLGHHFAGSLSSSGFGFDPRRRNVAPFFRKFLEGISIQRGYPSPTYLLFIPSCFETKVWTL